MCDRTGPDTGATLRLSALGQQDTYLLGGESPFKYEMKQHSNFRKFHRNFNVNKPSNALSGWPFGQTIKVTFRPQDMGDLLSNMYIRVKLPALSSQNYNYADRVGRHLFKTITMRADENILEIYRDDIGFIHDESFMTQSEIVSRPYSDGRFIYRSTVLSDGFKEIRTNESVVYVNIPFFFSRSYESTEHEINMQNRPYFPLCAMNKQKLEFEIEFRPQTFFTNDTTELTVDNFDIITEEIVLTPEERLFYTSKKYEMITDIFKTHPKFDTEINNDRLKLELTPEGQVRTMFFFLRYKEFEKENEPNHPTSNREDYQYFHNRFNCSIYDSYIENTDYLEDEPILSAKLYINGESLPNISYPDTQYYRYLTKLHYKLNSTARSIYTYGFSMLPKNAEPSGSLDFADIKNSRTVLDLELRNPIKQYTVHIYYKAYQVFTFENGYVTVRSKPVSYPTGTEEQDTGDNSRILYTDSFGE